MIGRPVDLTRSVDFVERLRPGKAASGGRQRRDIGSYRGRELGALSCSPGRLANELDVRRYASHRRGINDEDRNAERAQPRNTVRWGIAIAAGDDEVGLQADDLLRVDRPECCNV